MKINFFLVVSILSICIGCQKEELDPNQIVPVEILVANDKYSGSNVTVIGCFDQDPEITAGDVYIGYKLKECITGAPSIWLILNRDTTNVGSLKSKLGKKLIIQGIYVVEETFYPGGSQVLHTLSSATIIAEPAD